ncbi:MAG TPA: Yip1 family protein [Lacipirellulaceae bacterium]|nr:Yip1 family protein [Lacipirellulaceae bacterium]
MTTTTISSTLPLRLMFHPSAVFEELSETRPSPSSVFFRFVIWMAAIPPIMAYLGASQFGWRLGAREALYLPNAQLLAISIGYFLALLFGFVSTAVISQWMASTYGARHSLGIHFALVTLIGLPLVIGSIIHLFPHVFINVLVLVPALIWSMYLLFRGLPVVLKISPERGMLMASSIIAYLLVASVSLLGISVMLWGWGIGPAIGV